MSWLSKINPTPTFPPYSGPYEVGSVDVELPAHELESPSPAPEDAPATVAFRIFYPCEPSTHERPVWWIPSPQRGYVSAYARFLGAGSAFADLFALFPQLLYHVKIPVHRNARLLTATTESQRWPVMFFSHGLGGSRNAYSHICGSLSSHGIVVIAPDHRDGSSPISYIRATGKTEAEEVFYRSFPHKPSPEVYEGRDQQLKIRLWEMGLIHDAALKIDAGKSPHNLDPNCVHCRKTDKNEVLSIFQNSLDVHRPGSITWAGHSYGGATIVQFVKSVHWRPSSEKPGYIPLFTPAENSNISKQITSNSPVALLDLWCLPLKSPSTTWLWNKPMPCYDTKGPGGTALLAILSEAFFKWTTHLETTKKVLSESPSSDVPMHNKPAPHFFYPVSSAHLSQSDFGILFQWVAKKVFKAEEPERTLKINVRAILQVMRDSGIEVADTSAVDLEEEKVANGEGIVNGNGVHKEQDWKILDPTGKYVRGWIPLTTDPEEAKAEGKMTDVELADGPDEAVVEGEVLGQVTSREEMRQERL